MFTSIEESTTEEWATINKAQANHRGREYRNVLSLIHELAYIEDGFGIDQLSHSLQVATRAVESPHSSSPIVVAALCHDMAKPLSLDNHPAVAAEILKPFVSQGILNVVLHHGIFLADHTHGTNERARYRDCPWFPLAVEFAKWDQLSFDPHYASFPLGFFETHLKQVFGI